MLLITDTYGCMDMYYRRENIFREKLKYVPIDRLYICRGRVVLAGYRYGAASCLGYCPLFRASSKFSSISIAAPKVHNAITLSGRDPALAQVSWMRSRSRTQANRQDSHTAYLMGNDSQPSCPRICQGAL